MNKKEIYRYLRYGKNTPDEDVERLIDECIEEYSKEIFPCSTYQIYPCTECDDGIMLGEILLKGRSIKRCLHGCSRAVLFAATLTQRADFIIKKTSITDMAKAAVFQAVFAQGIEEYIDSQEAQIEANEHVKLRPRFSPGYGDLPLETQREIFRCLDLTKRLGITLTDGCLMVPTKSVTAVIGINE